MKQHMMTHKLRDMPQHMFGNAVPNAGVVSHPSMSPQEPTNLSSTTSLEPRESHQIRIKSESELSPRSTADGNSKSSPHSTDRHQDRRERSQPATLPFQMQPENTYQLMLERQQIKNESRNKRSPTEIDQPSPKRPLGKFPFLSGSSILSIIKSA